MAKKNDGIRKAAILLIALGPDTSSKILKRLPNDLIQEVTNEIASIDYVESQEKNQVLENFVDMASARQYVLDGGYDYAKNLLNKALGSETGDEVLDVLSQIQQRQKPFAIARKADTAQLINLLLGEHPQTIALIMCYIQANKAAVVLSEFPRELQIEVSERICNINRASPDTIARIESIMEDKFSNLIENRMETVGGVSTLVDILNSVDRGTEKNIIGDLEKTNLELAETIKASLFVFEDIITLDRGSVQRILREISNEDLALALKDASEAVYTTIFSNMSERASEMLKEDIEFMGPVRISTVEEAQQKVVGVIRRLEEAGEIVISRGDQDGVIV